MSLMWPAAPSMCFLAWQVPLHSFHDQKVQDVMSSTPFHCYQRSALNLKTAPLTTDDLCLLQPSGVFLSSTTVNYTTRGPVSGPSSDHIPDVVANEIVLVLNGLTFSVFSLPVCASYRKINENHVSAPFLWQAVQSGSPFCSSRTKPEANRRRFVRMHPFFARCAPPLCFTCPCPIPRMGNRTLTRPQEV